MTYTPTTEELCSEFQANIDVDPRYWDQDTGVVEWHGHKIAYTKHSDEIEVTFKGEVIRCPRYV